MYMNEQLARSRHQQDLFEADRRRLVRALTAQRRASRLQARADRADTHARLRVAAAAA